jgi:hypothetical protein
MPRLVVVYKRKSVGLGQEDVARVAVSLLKEGVEDPRQQHLRHVQRAIHHALHLYGRQ